MILKVERTRVWAMRQAEIDDDDMLQPSVEVRGEAERSREAEGGREHKQVICFATLFFGLGLHP